SDHDAPKPGSIECIVNIIGNPHSEHDTAQKPASEQRRINAYQCHYGQHDLKSEEARYKQIRNDVNTHRNQGLNFFRDLNRSEFRGDSGHASSRKYQRDTHGDDLLSQNDPKKAGNNFYLSYLAQLDFQYECKDKACSNCYKTCGGQRAQANRL